MLGLEKFGIAHEWGSSHGLSRIIRLAYHEDPRCIQRTSHALHAERRLACTHAQMFIGCLSVGDGLPQACRYVPLLRRAYELWEQLGDEAGTVGRLGLCESAMHLQASSNCSCCACRHTIRTASCCCYMRSKRAMPLSGLNVTCCLLSASGGAAHHRRPGHWSPRPAEGVQQCVEHGQAAQPRARGAYV